MRNIMKAHTSLNGYGEGKRARTMVYGLFLWSGGIIFLTNFRYGILKENPEAARITGGIYSVYTGRNLECRVRYNVLC